MQIYNTRMRENNQTPAPHRDKQVKTFYSAPIPSNSQLETLPVGQKSIRQNCRQSHKLLKTKQWGRELRTTLIQIQTCLRSPFTRRRPDDDVLRVCTYSGEAVETKNKEARRQLPRGRGISLVCAYAHARIATCALSIITRARNSPQYSWSEIESTQLDPAVLESAPVKCPTKHKQV